MAGKAAVAAAGTERRGDAYGFRSIWESVEIAAQVSSKSTYGRDLFAAAMAFGVNDSNVEMVDEVVVVSGCQLIEKFFCKEVLALDT